ncbi:MAG: hypothetical protein AB1782_17245 [Cyanobacteriota bacterium]
MYWASFLHIYQPPTQTEEIVLKVTNESYRKIVKILLDNPEGKFSFNINASLTEQLIKYKLDDVIEGIGQLAERGQIEFTGSALYHPILPLIPDSEIERQIELNTKVNKDVFGDIYNPVGFFPPEMCVSHHLAEVVKKMGFRWMICDELGYKGKVGTVKYDKIYEVEGLDDFYVFFNNRDVSSKLTFGLYPTITELKREVLNNVSENNYLLTGTDGEIYGHHRIGQEVLLKQVLEDPSIDLVKITSLVDLFKEREVVKVLDSSWSAWEYELEDGVPFPQWNYPDNEIHKMQWDLTYLVIDTLNKLDQKKVKNYETSRDLLDKGLHSCQWWWSSCRPWWNTYMIEMGAMQLYDAINIIKENIDLDTYNKAFQLAHNIIDTSKYWHINGTASDLKAKYKSKVPAYFNELTFG